MSTPNKTKDLTWIACCPQKLLIMRALFVALVPVVVSLMAVTAIKNSQNTVKPNRKDGYAPIGNARFSDYNQLDGTLSFWQLEPHRITKYQL